MNFSNTILKIHKDEMKELMDNWKEFSERKVENDVVGLVMWGAALQLLKQSLDKAGKYFTANNKYIEELEKRLDEVDFIK